MKWQLLMNAAKKSDREEAGNDDCNDNACRSCPVCYVFISQPFYQWHAKELIHKKNYPEMDEADSCSFTAFIWKPPNASRYFS